MNSKRMAIGPTALQSHIQPAIFAAEYRIQIFYFKNGLHVVHDSKPPRSCCRHPKMASLP